MVLSFLRDKLLSFVLPVCVVSAILGGALWIIATTYFWDTSTITITLPTDEPTKVVLTVQARLVYHDFVFLGFPYALHLTLPWSSTSTCEKTCTITHVPSGDGSLLLASATNQSGALLFVAPDTRGSLDLREALVLSAVSDETVSGTLRVPALSETERAAFSEIIFTNTIEGLYLVEISGETKLYDALSKQILALPGESVDMVGRGETAGTYILHGEKGISLYDRYGRSSLSHLEHLSHNAWTWTWDKKTTTITGSTGAKIMEGIWWPLQNDYMTNGSQIFQIQTRK